MLQRLRLYVACEVCLKQCTRIIVHIKIDIGASRSSPRVDRRFRQFICWQHLIAFLHPAVYRKHQGTLLSDACAPTSRDGLSPIFWLQLGRACHDLPTSFCPPLPPPTRQVSLAVRSRLETSPDLQQAESSSNSASMAGVSHISHMLARTC